SRALALGVFFQRGGARAGKADAADPDAVLEIEGFAIGHDDLARNDAELTLFTTMAFDDIAGADRKSARELAHSHETLSYGTRAAGQRRRANRASPCLKELRGQHLQVPGSPGRHATSQLAVKNARKQL